MSNMNPREEDDRHCSSRMYHGELLSVCTFSTLDYYAHVYDTESVAQR